MDNQNEVEKALCRTLAEIAAKEKRKALQKDDYGNALVASFFEGVFREAEQSS